jgi:hypothetical protein
MNSYELLPHEHDYTLFLSYVYDLWHYDPMILNIFWNRIGLIYSFWYKFPKHNSSNLKYQEGHNNFYLGKERVELNMSKHETTPMKYYCAQITDVEAQIVKNVLNKICYTQWVIEHNYDTTINIWGSS